MTGCSRNPPVPNKGSAKGPLASIRCPFIFILILQNSITQTFDILTFKHCLTVLFKSWLFVTVSASNSANSPLVL